MPRSFFLRASTALSAVNKVEGVILSFIQWMQADLEREGRDRASESVAVALAKVRTAVPELHPDHLSTALPLQGADDLIEEWRPAAEAFMKTLKFQSVVIAAPADEEDEEPSE